MFLGRYRGRGQVQRGVPPKLTNPVILFCTLVDFDFWPRLHQVLDAQQGLSATAAYTRRSARMRAATTAIPTFTTPSTTSRWTPAYLRLAKMKSGQPWLILSLLSSTCDWSSHCCYVTRLMLKWNQDNRELENVYEEIQKKMGKRSIEKSSSSQAQVHFTENHSQGRLVWKTCKYITRIRWA